MNQKLQTLSWLLFALLAAGFAPLTTAETWQISVEPYGMATSIEGDAGVGRATGVPVDVDFDTILENLEMAGMVHFEAHHESGWGVILDYGFMDLGADISGPRGGIVDASVRQSVFEALLAQKIDLNDTQTLTLTGGIRWWDNEVDVTVDPAVLPGTRRFDIDEDWIDLIVGARWANQLNQQWAIHLQGDVGGFGLESDFTASAAIGATYAFSERYVLDLKYKATWVDFSSGSSGRPDSFSYDTVTHGPLIGLIINF